MEGQIRYSDIQGRQRRERSTWLGNSICSRIDCSPLCIVNLVVKGMLHVCQFGSPSVTALIQYRLCDLSRLCLACTRVMKHGTWYRYWHDDARDTRGNQTADVRTPRMPSFKAGPILLHTYSMQYLSFNGIIPGTPDNAHVLLTSAYARRVLAPVRSANHRLGC